MVRRNAEGGGDGGVDNDGVRCMMYCVWFILHRVRITVNGHGYSYDKRG